MADKNIQIKDLQGNLLFPKTKGAVVINNAGANLGGVEAGAQVNVLEGIKIDGVALPITNKIAEYTTPTAAEYTIAKKATANAGYLASYELQKDGVAVGDAINIPKDFLVKSATMGVCETADQPIAGLKPGDPYLDFVVNTKGDAEAEADQHLYINVATLVDVYTEGNGINIANNVISVDTTDSTIVDATPTENSVKFVQSGGVFAQLATKQDKITASNKLDADLVDDTTADHKFVTADEKATWNGKQDAIADLATIRSNATAGKAAKDALDNGEYQETIDADNKLDADLVDDTTADHKFVSTTEKATWNAKQNAITGAATTITDANLTASMILASDANGKVSATAVPANTLFLTYEEIV